MYKEEIRVATQALHGRLNTVTNLQCVVGTPMEVLVDAIQLPVLLDKVTQSGADQDDVINETLQMDWRFRNALNELVDNLAIPLSSLVMFVRDDFVKKVEIISSELDRGINNKGLSRVIPYEIVVVEENHTYSSDQALALANQFSHVTADQVHILKLGMVAENLEKYTPGVDLEKWCCCDVDEVKDILRGDTVIPDLYSDITVGTAHLLILVLQNLYNEPPEGYNRKSLEDYNLEIAAAIAQCGRILAVYFNKYEQTVKHDVLYLNTRSDDAGTIKVHGEVYKAALERGLTPEHVLANEHMGRPWKTVRELLDNTEELLKVYNTMIKEGQRASEADVVKDGYHIVSTTVAKIINDEAEDGMIRGVPVDEYQRAANKRISEYRTTQPAMIAAISALTSVVYGHVEGLDTLVKYCEWVGEQHPDANGEQVLGMAVMKYVYTWVASQMRIVV